MFNVGGQGDDQYEVHIARLTVVANSNPQTNNIVFEDITSAGDGWVYLNDNGNSTATVVNGKVVIDVTNPDAGIWEQKLFHEPIQLSANKVYKLTYTIHATENKFVMSISQELSLNNQMIETKTIFGQVQLCQKMKLKQSRILLQPMTLISMILICFIKLVVKKSLS